MPASGHKVALGVTLAVVGVLLVIAATFFTVRMRRAKAEQDVELSKDEKLVPLPARTKSTILDPRHPATRITPFGSEYNHSHITLTFNH